MLDANGNLLGQMEIRSVPLGAMGYCTGIVTASDESWQLVKTDGAGAWRRDGATGIWTQCFRRDNTSAALFGIDPTFGESDGTWEAEIARGNTAVAYASFRHRIVKSLDSGATWTLCTAVPEMQMNSNAADSVGGNASYQRLAFGKLTIDPTNASVVYWGPEGGGLLRTLDGMATYSTIASVPAAVSPYSRAITDDRYMQIAVDETSALTSGRHSKVAVASIGNGIYLSTDGGNTFSQISATLLYPTNIQFINGVLWVMDYVTTGNVATAGNNIYTYNGSWSAGFGHVSQPIRFVQPDLTNPSVIFSGRLLYRSDNGGTSWVDVAGGDGSNAVAVGHDAPMIAGVFNSGKQFFNTRLSAHSNGRVYLGTGYGIMYVETANWKAASNPSVDIVLHEDTAGIENIVPQAALITPNGAAFMVNQDKAIIKVAPDGQFPTASYPASQLVAGYDIDYAASDPAYVAGIYGVGNVAYSLNGGASFTDCATKSTTKQGGCIVVIAPGHMVHVPGQNGWPAVTTDNGATWTDSTFSGFAKISSGETGWGFGANDTDRFICCNDKDNNPLHVWIYNYGVGGSVAATVGIWKSTDGGFTFTRIHATKIISSILYSYHNRLSIREGILWFNSHFTTPYNSENAGSYLYRSTDGGVTWAQVPTLSEPYCYAFTKPLHEGDYPALWALGWVGGVNGLWRCDNADAATTGDMVWVQDEQSLAFARPTAMTGHPAKYGELLVGRGGMGWERLRNRLTMRLR